MLQLVEPNNSIGYDDRAFVYLKLKKFQLAIDDYNKFDDSNKNPEKKIKSYCNDVWS